MAGAPAAPGLPGRPVETDEGGVRFWLPTPTGLRGERGPAEKAAVFYNPAMALARDIEVAVVDAWAAGRRIRVWDALCASGIRGLRLAVETPWVEELLATEGHPQALAYAEANLRRDGLRAQVRAWDARSPPEEAAFDLVDLDPYGTPAPFVEAGLTAVRPGGLLALTATDMAVLAGPEGLACRARYGGRPLRTYLCREAGLRVLLGFVARKARALGREVRPLLSLTLDHHVRLYLEVGDARSGELPLQEVPFPGYEGPPIPPANKGGPMWWGPLHAPELVGRLEVPSRAARARELVRLLEVLKEEAGVDVPFYYATGEISRHLGLPFPPSRKAVFAALRGAGFDVARTHLDPTGWRTRAPAREVLPLLRGLGPAPSR